MKDKTAKISDFGLTKIKHENEIENSIPFGFSPFYAPESPYCQSYPADVFQLSICLYEIFERNSIVDYYLSKQIPRIYTLDQNRPPLTNKTPAIWQELISSMWYTNPLKRVKMDYVIDEIEKEEYFIEGSNVEEIKQFIKNTKQKEDEIYHTKINEDVKYLIKTEDKEENAKSQYYIFNFLTAVDSSIDKFKFDEDQIKHTQPNVEKNAKKGGKKTQKMSR